jgi:hypothetical protein
MKKRKKEEPEAQEQEAKPEGLVLTRYLSVLGFRSVPAHNELEQAEFAKTYIDPSGKLGRVTLVLDKDVAGMDPERVAKIVITVQTDMPADEQTIITKAPQFCREDLSRFITFFNNYVGPEQNVEVSCTSCNARVTSYVSGDSGPVCFECH